MATALTDRGESRTVASQGPASRAISGMARAAFCLTFASAALILFSIALSQTLMALALAALLLSGERFWLPPLKAPLAAIFITTLIALAFSPDPYGGIPQIRKFYVFAILLLITSTFKTMGQARALLAVWATVATLSAFVGLAQYLERRHEAVVENANNYDFFLDDRIRGFAGHWMTFGGEQMIVLLMLGSLILFGVWRWNRMAAMILVPLLWASIVLSLTRSIFLLGVPVGMLYLLWRWNRWAVIALPLLAAAAILLAPFQVRERVVSVVRPHGDVDSNSHRAVTRLVGWKMVQAHPWFGLGPEQIKPQFNRYVPPSVPRPLPHGWYGHLHNIYLQYAAERGIPGLLAILWFVGKALLDFARALRGRLPRGAPFLLHGAIAVILAILAEGFFEYNLGDSEVLTMFLAVIGLAYACTRARGQADPSCA